MFLNEFEIVAVTDENGEVYGDVESYIISTLLTTEDEEVWEKLKDTMSMKSGRIPGSLKRVIFVISDTVLEI